jgi:hypothetical protein
MYKKATDAYEEWRALAQPRVHVSQAALRAREEGARRSALHIKEALALVMSAPSTSAPTSSDDADLPSYASSASVESGESADTDDPFAFSDSSSDSSASDAALDAPAALAGLDARLVACYHAIFGLAGWVGNSARLRELCAFIRLHSGATWTIRTLEDFYYHCDSVLNLLRWHDFLTAYEDTYSDWWARVSMDRAVTRLESLHTVLRARSPSEVEQRIAGLMAAHAAPAARNRAILEYLTDFAPRAPFDVLSPDATASWFNAFAGDGSDDSGASEASEAGDAGEADEHDKENRRPSPARAPASPSSSSRSPSARTSLRAPASFASPAAPASLAFL